MCGDGANDCGALRAAHVGISLSEAESSVAAPFTARDPHIGCVPQVIREGRAALCTSFGIFKFMVAYSLTEFASAIILYGMDSNLTDLQFLFVDICLVMNFAFFFSKTDSFSGPLDPRPPQTSLLSLNPLSSIGLQVALNVVLQTSLFHLVRTYSFWKPFVPKDNYDYACLENYSVFCISMFQYISMAIVFSQGAPYRKSLWSNWQFTSSLALMSAICAYITLGNTGWVNAALQLIVPPLMEFRLIIVGLAVVGFSISFFLQKVFVEHFMTKKLRYWRHDVYKSRRKYLAIEHQLRLTRPHWPPIDNAKSPIIMSLPSSEQLPTQQPVPPTQQSIPPTQQSVSPTQTAHYDNPGFVGDNMVTKF